MTVKGARYSGCDVSFGKREKLLATGNRQVGWSSSGRTTSLILHLFQDITLHFSQTNSRKDISFKYKKQNWKLWMRSICGVKITWNVENEICCIASMESKNILSYKQMIQTNFTCTMISIPGFTIMKVLLKSVATMWCRISNDTCLQANMPPSPATNAGHCNFTILPILAWCNKWYLSPSDFVLL